MKNQVKLLFFTHCNTGRNLISIVILLAQLSVASVKKIYQQQIKLH